MSLWNTFITVSDWRNFEEGADEYLFIMDDFDNTLFEISMDSLNDPWRFDDCPIDAYISPSEGESGVAGYGLSLNTLAGVWEKLNLKDREVFLEIYPGLENYL